MTGRDFGIQRNGRSWSGDEFKEKAELVPGRLEIVNGRVCSTLEQRLLLLGMLLENVDLDAAVRLGDPRLWAEALADRQAAPALEPAELVRQAEKADLVLSQEAREPSLSRRTWNYRVIRFEHAEETSQALHEVHYEAGRPVAYSAEPAVVLWGEDDDSCAPLWVLERMKEALLKPVLTEADFRGAEGGLE